MNFIFILIIAVLAAGFPFAPNITHISTLVERFNPLPNDPEDFPVGVEDLATNATMACGSSTFSYDDVYEAVQWGTLLQDAGISRGQRDKKRYPNGRFPHAYTETLCTFNDDCPADDNRQEYPLVTNGPYNGSPNNDSNWGYHRVVYYRKPGQVGIDGHDLVYFCGGITHEGAPSVGAFVQCTVY